MRATFNHSDNRLDRLGCQGRIADLLADRVLTGEILVRQRLVDDHHPRLCLILGIAEVAAARQLRPDRLEKLRTHVSLIHFDVLPVIGLSNKANPLGVPVETDRQHSRERGGLHSGQAFDLAHQFPAQRDALFVVPVANIRSRHRDGRQVIRPASQPYVQQPVQALAE